MGPGFDLPTRDGHALFFLVTVSLLFSDKGSVDRTAFDHLNSINFGWSEFSQVFSFSLLAIPFLAIRGAEALKRAKKRKCPFLLMRKKH